MRGCASSLVIQTFKISKYLLMEEYMSKVKPCIIYEMNESQKTSVKLKTLNEPLERYTGNRLLI